MTAILPSSPCFCVPHVKHGLVNCSVWKGQGSKVNGQYDICIDDSSVCSILCDDYHKRLKA